MTDPGSRPQSATRGGRRRVLYGRRVGRPLRKGRRRLVETLLPRLALPLDEDAPPVAPLDPRTLFTPPPASIWLEVGFGAGEHLAAQAEAHPEIGFLGCEPFLNGVAALLARIEAAGLANIRIHAGDARFVLEVLADRSLDRVFVLFPDPWPKRRHAKRRFIQPNTLDALARVMRPGAELRLATDDRGFMRWTLRHLLRRAEFEWLAEGPEDWRRRPADQPATRYEEKARERGRPAVFLNFRRRGSATT